MRDMLQIDDKDFYLFKKNLCKLSDALKSVDTHIEQIRMIKCIYFKENKCLFNYESCIIDYNLCINYTENQSC